MVICPPFMCSIDAYLIPLRASASKYLNMLASVVHQNVIWTSSMVSVIIPVLETKWLPEALESIKAKEYTTVETIVVDDKERSGPAAARNRGLEKASGEYVLFCDSDDYLEPGAIDKLISEMDGVDMVCGSFRKFGDFEMTVQHQTETLTPWQVAQYVMTNLLSPGSNQMLSGCWAKLFRRELIGKFPDLTTAEDMAFNFDYLMRCNEVRFISDIVYHNRKRQGSLTTTFDAKDSRGLFGFLEGLKYVKNFMSQFYPADELEDALDSSKVYHSMLYFSRIAGCGRGTFKRLYL